MPRGRWRGWMAICARLMLSLLGMAPSHRATAQSSTARGGARAAADSSWGLRIIVSTGEHRLWVMDDADTIYASLVAVGSGRRLSSRGRTWIFETPLGQRTVISKDSAPVWVPPDWYYIETARANDLAVAYVDFNKPVTLADGRVLTLRGGTVGVIGADSLFAPLPLDEHIVFGGTLYVPPLGSKNREQHGTLGNYRLNLGDAVGMHGTNEPSSVGKPVTHGCMRLYDRDIEWLYRMIPIGTRVYIY